MRNQVKKLTNRILSAACALSLFAGTYASMLPVSEAAATPQQEYAHTVTVFDIDIKQGADYYSTYYPEDPRPADPEDSSVTPGVVSFTNPDGSGVYVWEADAPTEGHKFVYNIKFSVSGEGATDQKPDDMDEDKYKEAREAVGEEFVKIRVPAHILKLNGQEHAGIAMNGMLPDELEMPVPNIEDIPYKLVDGEKVYSSDHDFVYKLDDKKDDDPSNDEYIIFNLNPVSAGVVYEFPVAYQTNFKTWEYQDIGASAPCFATLDLRTWPKNADPGVSTYTTYLDGSGEKPKTREIPVYIDTTAKIKDQNKSVSKSLMSAEAARSLTGLSGDAIQDNYLYTLWNISTDVQDVTQKYNFTLNDEPKDLTGTDADGKTHTVKGELVAINVGAGWTSVLTANTVTGLTSTSRRTDMVLTRYPINNDGENEGINSLENAARDAVYTAKNDSTGTVTPADGQDAATTKGSNASFRIEYKLPTLPPIEEKYTAVKYGLYNKGQNRVGGKNNITSFEMMKLSNDEPLPGLLYETGATAHAYGRTIDSLNALLGEMKVPATPDTAGNVIIDGGARKFIFDINNTSSFTRIRCDENGNEIDQEIVAITNFTPATEGKLTGDEILGIAAQDLADNFYGKKDLKYVFEDKDFTVSNIPTDATKAVTMPLDKDDYTITSLRYNYTARKASYDADKVEFSYVNELDPDQNNVLEFWVFVDDNTEPVLAATYNVCTGDSNIIRDDLVTSVTDSLVTFAEDSRITGYQVKTHNHYFLIELKTFPELKLLPSEKLSGLVTQVMDDKDMENKLAINNKANWSVFYDYTNIYSRNITGTDYIADIVRDSKISKEAIGEKSSIRGRDNKVYRSHNDTLNGHYEQAWKVSVSETADGVEVDGVLASNVPVVQQSGIFYDLLPAHSEVIPGSVNVYVDTNKDAINEKTASLPPTDFEIINSPEYDNYNGSGKKLLVIKINVPCQQNYVVSYVTVHTHEDLQDYGSLALNTVAYQTGNADIGGGYPDNGGNHAVSMSDYIIGLDPDNDGAKRFIYAEATQNILALFPTSSGIFKKVATSTSPTYGKSGTVHNGETYSYSIRMQNSSSTKARDIAILDSLENYRTVNGVRYNYGIDSDRGWNGTLVGVDLSGIENKFNQYIDADKVNHSTTKLEDIKLLLYVGDNKDDIVDLNGEAYSDTDARMYLLNKILGQDSKLEAALEKMAKQALEDLKNDPDFTMDEAEQTAFKENFKTAAKTKYDAVAEKWRVVDWRTLAPVDGRGDIDLEKVSGLIVYTGTHFVLGAGESLSFTVKMKTPDEVIVDNSPVDVASGKFLPPKITYNNIYRSFTSVPESVADTSEEGAVYYYTHYDYTQLNYNVTGDLNFYKKDAVTGEGVSGVQFNLSGISDYGTIYDETLYSASNGAVSFMDLERGTYKLIETVTDPDHVLDSTEKTVQVDPRGNVTIVTIDGVVVQDETTHDYSILNQPRYHGEFEFYKRDSYSKNGIAGATFMLTGISDHDTTYEGDTALYATSDASGRVSFGDIERGTYTLTEVSAPNGYVLPESRTFKVQGTGTKDVIFKILDNPAAENDGGEYSILNAPTRSMMLQKADSITGGVLKDGQFTITADPADAELNTAIENLADGPNNRWELQDGKRTQTIDNANTSNGCYDFTLLPKGKYTLTEDRAPSGYTKTTKTYTIEVKPNADGDLVVVLPTDMQYIKTANGGYAPADENDATYYRLTNDQEYTQGKTIIKSWIGGLQSAPKFPSLHLSSEKPEEKAKIATIWSKTDNGKTGLKLLIENHQSEITGFEMHELPEGITPTRTENPNLQIDQNTKKALDTGTDTSYEDETGIFYAWWDDNAKKVYWWSDADIIYMPKDCYAFFESIGNTGFTSVDLSKFDFSRVTTMRRMFSKCTSLKTVTFPEHIDTSSLIYMGHTEVNNSKGNYDGMFAGCSSLETIDLSGFDTENVITMEELFRGCSNLKSVNLTGLDTRNVVNMRLMFADLGKSLNSADYIDLDISSFSTEKLTNVTDMFTSATGIKKLSVGPNFKLNAVGQICDTSGGGIRFNHLKNLEEFNGSQYLECKKCTLLCGAFENVGENIKNNNLVLNLSGLSGENVTNLNNVFKNCGAKEINLQNFNTEKVDTGVSFFYGCKQLEKLTIGENFKLNGVALLGDWKNGSCIFGDTVKLKEFVGSQYLELRSATQLTSMFQSCGSDVENNQLVLDLSGMVANNATSTKAMFQSCGAKTINIGNLQTSQVTNMANMFNGCSVVTVYVDPTKWSTSGVTTSDDMFKNCSKIKGGAGTTYKGAGIIYAKVDGGSSDPGYFTDIADKPATSSNSQPAGSPAPAAVAKAGRSTIILPSAPSNTIVYGSSPAAETYKNFTFTSETDPKEIEDATPETVTVGKSFKFEYVTADGSKAEDVEMVSDTEYKVKETVTMTVITTYLDTDSKYYTVEQTYTYTEPVIATWTQVTNTAPAQWYCELSVQKADDEYYAWEDVVTDFNSSNDSNNTVYTVGAEDQPVITNTSKTAKVGDLKITKKVDGGSRVKDEYFWVKVTMYEADGTTPYTMKPFDENGVHYYKIKDGETVIIKSIPEGYKYTVEEPLNDTDHPMPAGYEYVSGNVTADSKGTITAATPMEETITNTVLTTGLTLTKETEYWRMKDGVLTTITEPTDEERTAWQNIGFSYTLTFEDLISGKVYPYTITGNGGITNGTFTASKTSPVTTVENITLKGGQTLTINGLPQGAKYSISEASFTPSDLITYEVSTTVTGGNPSTGDTYGVGPNTLTATADAVTYKNIKQSKRPETIDVTINKEWYTSDGEKVTWMKNDKGRVVKFIWDTQSGTYIPSDDGALITMLEGTNTVIPNNYPSYLKVYLGSALKYEVEGQQTLYFDVTTVYSLQSLQATSANSWSYTFTDLPKYGSMVLDGQTVQLPYVYFVTEDEPLGFESCNDEDEKTVIRSSLGNVECYLVNGDTRSFTLKNKAEETCDLTISKQVTGNLGNRQEDFNFSVSFFDKDGNALTGVAGLTTVFKDVATGKVERSRTYTLETNTQSVSLADGKSVTFTGLPKGTMYSIVENGAADYNTTIAPTVGGVQQANITGKAVPKTALNSNTSYAYTNDRSSDIPTGASVPAAAALGGAIALSGALFLTRRKRRPATAN
ncbi:MAG: BspA family leucine-rich repeat surface protein [Ruminococcus sp.]|nr:BspA family leucine-rich repeat surface protein [Ruminococcus sp.]